jgi:hypothetical protein
VSGNNLAIHRNDYRICKAKALDGIRNLPDLLFRMGTGIAGVRTQFIRRKILDLKLAHLAQSHFEREYREGLSKVQVLSRGATKIQAPAFWPNTSNFNEVEKYHFSNRR